MLVGHGGCLLCEEFTYPHVVESLGIPLGIKLHGVAMDADGLQPDSLRQVRPLRPSYMPVPCPSCHAEGGHEVV